MTAVFLLNPESELTTGAEVLQLQVPTKPGAKGTLCVIEPRKITGEKFPVARRMYYIMNNSGEKDPRAGHFHPDKDEILFVMLGSAEFHLRTEDGREDRFTISDPHVAVYLPPRVWHTVTLSGHCVLGVLSPREYQTDESVAEFE